MKRKIVLFATLAGFLSITLSSYKLGFRTHQLASPNTNALQPIVNLCGDKVRHVNVVGCGASASISCHGFIPGAGQAATGNPNLQVGINIYSDAAHAHKVFTMDPSGTYSGLGWQPNKKYYVQLWGQWTAPTPAVDTAFGYQVYIDGSLGSSGTPFATGTVGNWNVASDTMMGGTNGQPLNSYGIVLESTNTVVTGHRYVASDHRSYEVDFEYNTPMNATDADTIHFAALICAVNNDGLANGLSAGDSDDFNDITAGGGLTGWPWRPSLTSVNQVFNNTSFSAYPNPVADNALNITMSGAPLGAYTVNVFDMNGKLVSTNNISVTSSSYSMRINTAAWANGIYQVRLMKDDAEHVISVVKQ
jgi:hypothetical protein